MSPDQGWDPAATLLVAFGAAIVATSVLVAIGGTRWADTDIVVYVILAGLISLTARWWAGSIAAVMLWCFYDGFLVGRHGVISWHGRTDAWRLSIIVAGAVVGWLVHRAVRTTAQNTAR
jgi:hypothetical protein